MLNNGLLAKLRSKKGVWYASYMVAELSSWQVHQGCSFWPIIGCFTHQRLSTLKLHTWPFSVLCLIDDLVDTGENQLYLYADDSTLFAPIRSVNETASVFTSLNRDLEKMRVWAAKWKVTFEPTKCKALMLSRKRASAIPDLYFGNTKLAVETELSILGVEVDSKLLWSRHISNISKNAGQRLGALSKIANKLDIAGRTVMDERLTNGLKPT